METKTPFSREDLLQILETTTHAQLRALRLLRRPGRPPGPATDGGPRPSNIEIVARLLHQAGKPLHIDEIMAQAKKRYGRKLSRESLVSALTKKVLDQNTFCRPEPNTFDLLNRPPRT
jgi:hypothetical protein